MVDSAITQEVIAQLTKPRLNAFQQAHILIQAIEAEIKRKPSWTVKEVRTAYAELIGKGVSKVNPTREGHLTGFAGEVIMSNGVRIFFKDPQVRERYGYGHINQQMEIMVAAEGVKGGVNFPEEKQRWLNEATRVFQETILGGRAGKSITDFFWREGVPVEHKAKTLARIYTDDSGQKVRKRTNEAFRGEAANKYIRQLQKTQSGVVIGWTWITVEYDRLDESMPEYQKAKQKVGGALLNLARALKTPVHKGKMWDKQLKGAFVAIGIQVEGFMPMVVSNQAFQKNLENKISLAEENTDRHMNTRVVEENIRHIEELIRARKKQNL